MLAERLLRILILVPAMFILVTTFRTEVVAQEKPSEFQARVQLLEERTSKELSAVTRDNWEEISTRWRVELQQMLGLYPEPDRTPLRTTVVGSMDVDDVSLDRMHFQSQPGLYVTANLYRPKNDPPEAGWPAILYVCGHARVQDKGRLLGNKGGYHHHGLWFARHGFVCLMIDTIQLGELHGEHHGTYKLGRWDWISRGYTPAGVEAWNAIRAIDLLSARDDVDPTKIGITGRSGGGAYSWFAAALDERIQAAVPVAGITDLRNHVLDGCVEGHCDCMYFVNYFGWDYGKLAALVAPRALMLQNSDRDRIFPLDGVMRIDRQLRTLYDRLGNLDNYGLTITTGPHQDTQELRVPAFKFLIKHLQGKSVDSDSVATKELDPLRLAVFEQEIPQDEITSSIASQFVYQASSISDPSEASEQVEVWLTQLRRRGVLPNKIEHLHFEVESAEQSHTNLQDVAGHGIRLIRVRTGNKGTEKPIVHLLLDGQHSNNLPLRENELPPNRTHYFVHWRGADKLRPGQGWSVKSRNQWVRRHYLLGQMPEALALQDFLSSLQWIESQEGKPLELAGTGRESLLITLASLVSEQAGVSVDKLYLGSYPLDPNLIPALPGMLQVCHPTSLLAAAESRLKIERQNLTPLSEARLIETASEPQQANGIKIVEVRQHSAKIWARATRWSLPNLADLPSVEFEHRAGKHSTGAILPELGVDGLRYAVPGVEAEIRIGYRGPNDNSYRFTPWQHVDESTDYSGLFPIEDLEAGTNYTLRSQVRAPGASSYSSSLTGSFRTLPNESKPANFRLAISTCQSFVDRDGPHGFDLYRTILERSTDAFVMAGDVVYYDRLARSNELAYYHWQRTYSLPTLLHFYQRVPTFFLKDDHDTFVNDSWPGLQTDWTDEFTFSAGQQIFRQQTGLPTPAYRTFPVGNDMQVWLMEGRDYRSPNTLEDGASKTIWGKQQKAWLEETLGSSQARFKVIISPTPIVGPDRTNKRDNHANRVFETEGREVRELLASYPNTVAVCGDRHWQFHSIDPETGLHEFSVGPASQRHAGGWKQEDFRPEIHQYLRVGGGYLELELSGEDNGRRLVLRHLDCHGKEHHRYVME